MIRDILTNKWAIGAVSLLLIIAAGCYVWYQHTTAVHKRELERTFVLLKQWRNHKKTEKPITVDKSSTQASAKATTAEKTINASTINTKETENEGYFLTDNIYIGSKPPPIPVSRDEVISPYGFGPYPELPEGFGPITWPRKSADSELRIRVKIKLLKQGIPVEGSVMSNGLVYPIIKGIRYVTWGETSDGQRYLRRSRGHPDDSDYLRSIANEKEEQGETLTQDDVPHIKLIPMEEGGIDPYTFLNLPK